MNYVKSLNIIGVEAKEIPCITGAGAPSAATEGAVGLLYMDENTGDLYKCTAERSEGYTWEKLVPESSKVDISKSNGVATISVANKEGAETIKISEGEALRDTASGRGVQIYDVSSVEHTVKCKAHGKNLYDTLSNYKNGAHAYSDGTLTMTGRYAHKFIKLEEGKTYTFSCKSTRTGTDGGGVHIRAYKADQNTYVDIPGGSLINFLSPTFTLTMPEGYPYIRFAFYGHSTADGTGTATYTELQLEEGTEATAYEPYIDPATITVTRCGNNLLPFPYATDKFNGTNITFTTNADRSVTLQGTPTTDTQFDLVTELDLPEGEYSIAGNGKNVRARIIGADGVTRYSVDTFTISEGDKVRIYAVALANEEINYTFFPMLNVGASALDYEDYIGATYKTGADGAIEEMTSLFPAMLIFTDTAGTVVDVEYHKDINAAFEELNEPGAVARLSEVTIFANKWEGTASPYSQVVTVAGATKYSKVDLLPSVEQLAEFYQKGLAFVTENNNGVVTVYSVGDKPEGDHTIQVVITEVSK